MKMFLLSRVHLMLLILFLIPLTAQSSGPWAVNSYDHIYSWNGTNWSRMPGLAKDIGAGANGSVWVIGTNPVAGGYGIYQWDGKNWINRPGGAVRIDVSPNGIPWVVNSNGSIFQWTGSAWSLKPGRAKDIGIGSDGSVWVIGTNAVAGGYGIYKWNGSNWTNVSGGAVRIDVGANGVPWVVNASDNIFKWSGTGWQLMPGKAKDIGIGASGTWVIGTNVVNGGYGIYQWNGTRWQNMPGGAVQITVPGYRGGTGAGLAWAVGKPCASSRDFVISMYQSILERQPDQAGLNYWVGRLNAGKQRKWVIAQFFLAQGQSLKKNNHDFVRDAYQAILSREPEPQGYQTWGNSLVNHMPRDEMIVHFLHSDEFRNKTAGCRSKFNDFR